MANKPATAASPRLLIRLPSGSVAQPLALLGLVVIAFALRLVPILFAPCFDSADEVFQTTEQAHRLVYGTGLVPWEFQLGIRSWLVPGAIAGLMELARLFGDGPDYYLPLIAAACGILAVVPVVCCFLWCKRWFGLRAAIAGGACVAVAPELVYMGDRTLTEVLAAHLLVLALYRLDPAHRELSVRQLFIGGTLLGLVFVLRLQLAPAIAVIALATAMRGRARDLLPLAAGGLAVLAFAAVLDAAALGSPLASMWRYVLYNLYYGVSSTFGVEPWYYYLYAELAIWGVGLSAVLILAMLGTRQTALPLFTASVVVAAHSLIAHKEYRFIYPAIVLIAVQAGIGLAGLVHAAEKQLAVLGRRWRFAQPGIAVLAAGLWCGLSLLVWSGPVMAKFRQRGHDYILAARFVAHDASVCGIGTYGHNAWGLYGGYTYLHRPVPMYWRKQASELASAARAFDVLLYYGGSGLREPAMPPGFVKERCFGEACLARRSGRCEPLPPTPLPFPQPLARSVPHR